MGLKVNKPAKNRDALTSFDMPMPHQMILIFVLWRRCDGQYVV